MRAILVALMCMHVTIGAAQERISVDFNNTPYFEAVQILQKKLGSIEKIRYDLCFTHTRPITLKLDNESPEVVAARMSEGQPVEIRIVFKVVNLIPRDLYGLITDELGNPQEGVTVTGDVFKTTKTKADGTFRIEKGACDSYLECTSVNLKPHKEMVNSRTWVHIVMKTHRQELEEHRVYNDGYGSLPKERVTGSYFKLNETEVKRQVFSNAMDGWEQRVPGLAFNKNLLSWKNQPQIEIRGASTINAGTLPVVVIDNFPINNKQELSLLNPQDISTITVLKDAAATSIYGARAGNGVIVITTKKGKYNKPIQVYAASSIAVALRPDVYYMPAFTSSDYIDMETARYNAKYYKDDLANTTGLVSPVVLILQQFKDGNITEAQKNEQLNQLKKQDVRHDLSKFFYRNAITQRHFASIRGGTANGNYYLSAGYDGEQMSLVTARKERLTLNSGIQLKRKNWEVGMNSYFSYVLTKNDRAAPGGFYPFSRLKNSAGEPETVLINFNQHFKDSMLLYLQSWDYKPLQELYARSLTQKNSQYRIGLTATYSILDSLDFNVIYQYDQGRFETEDVSSVNSFQARHLVNSFANIKNREVTYVIPKGGFMDWSFSDYRSNRIRTQLNFTSRSWKKFSLIGLAGFEASTLQMDTTSFRFYGYFGDRQKPSLDYKTAFVQSYDSSKKELIPQSDKNSSGYDAFVSYYTNAAINYDNRYTFSFSARLDRSNLFGVKTNQKTIPLASAGIKWDVSEERFYSLKNSIPYMSFRASLGSSGNINKLSSAYISAIPIATTQGTVYSVISPGNPNLKWEKSKMLNIGFSLSDAGSHYYFTFDYFRRKSENLLGPGELDPITGASYIWGNFAQLKSKGYELSVKTDHDIAGVKLKNILSISRSTNKVTSYYNVNNSAGYFVDNNYLTPREGYPVYPILAFAWAGLEGTTGNPLGKLEGRPSDNYKAINEAPAETLVNKGSAVPTMYGALQPMITWEKWKFSFTVSGKFGYSFRRSSINYSDPYSTRLMGRNDFSNRWQKTGDQTNVPSMQIFNSAERDLFYAFSEVLVEKGDHLRLQDVRLEYDFRNMVPKTWKIQSVNAYIYAANLGTIWTANKLKIDPDYLLGPPVPKSITAGFSFEF